MNIVLTYEMEQEIAELKKDPDVALARKELRLKYKRRQELYQLRNLKKKGAELRAAGIDENTIDQLIVDEITVFMKDE